MQYIYNTTRIELPRRSILTLGKFDGAPERRWRSARREFAWRNAWAWMC